MVWHINLRRKWETLIETRAEQTKQQKTKELSESVSFPHPLWYDAESSPQRNLYNVTLPYKEWRQTRFHPFIVNIYLKCRFCWFFVFTQSNLGNWILDNWKFYCIWQNDLFFTACIIVVHESTCCLWEYCDVYKWN